MRKQTLLVRSPRDTKALQHTPKGVFDHVLDMYSPVGDLETVSINNGRAGFMQDGNRIRSYFEKAERKIGA